ncbi:LysR family transcriptional regulator [Hydrogenophaga crocea]|uniref:LysR family transcriptional regulator n=1 Tax=Hydrogenophaga crocea TaxID=2716225 RepID=A0A6G8IIY2_9BURK|nr:LysR family transcriptional regulator [Hydrogenophaga crocea]QIM53111.1 LysR family transcriptional regulator [Hydrogenophaga crocea]
MDRFQEMHVFAAVVDAGSFVAASDALGMSKAAVSRHVAELERRLGVRLLHRTTRRLSLTAEGETFHARCKAVLAEVDEAEAEITAGAGEARGTLRVNVPFSYGQQRLAPLWPRFMARHPALTLEVTLSDRVVDLVDEGFDLAVRIAQLPASTLISRRLAGTRLLLCASPGYVAARGAPQHPADIARHDCIAYTLFSSGDLWHFEGPDGPTAVKVQGRLRSNNGDTCVQAALQGQGLILQPSFLVDPHLRSGALVALMPGWHAVELGVYAVYPTRRHVAPKVRLLIDFLAQALDASDGPAPPPR